ncbi:GntR family transcriptional regulator [Actinomadura sp. NBRC 104412]|uniref:GntR family transcriptional regulator n=1 Tax=Actinomadura sp. NBRC 104412 TaxID=3032203 RepID=UPI0024A213EC|nr:GntR family transcriptional regulator [Actinomadura sp. NBRC 104412]GLZ03925.1 GntR family transcriptional regulator [Actinomadura sp. NBRC 104412]
MPARYEEIANDLQRQIEEGLLLPGQQIKTEKALMEEYDAARNTVREAISRLRVLRLLESRQGRGNFVVKPPEKFRITLTPEEDTGFSGGEGQAWVAEADKQHRRASTSTPDVLVKPADALMSKALDVPEGEQLIGRHQRRYITNEAGNPVPWSMQTSYYPFSFVQRGAVELMNAVDIEKGTMAYLKEALGIQQARYKDFLSVRPPEDEERSFFDLPAEGSVWIFVHRRTAYDTTDRPCRYTLTVYPTDRNEFIIEARLPIDDSQ